MPPATRANRQYFPLMRQRIGKLRPKLSVSPVEKYGEGDRKMTEKYSSLANLHQHAEMIFQEALKAVDPEAAIHSHIKFENNALHVNSTIFDLSEYDRILVLGAGKATAPMAKAMEDILGDQISDGLIVVKDGHGLPLKKIAVREAGHPLPDLRGVRGTEEIISLAEKAGERDLVLCLISGGGSALMIAPSEDINLEDKQETTRLLLTCGATIHEMNTIRKHLSRVKGGWLARLAYPSTLVSLILSDVVGDDLDVIASGPTVPDRSTFGDAKHALQRYSIWDQVPASVKNHIQQGVSGKIQDTPKTNDIVFQNCSQTMVGTNLQAMMAAGKAAERLGYATLILSSKVEGEAREVAKFYCSIAKEILDSGNPLPPPVCILSGGETTVTIEGDGKGGRNQEFALASALAISGADNIVVLSGGTDGTDGPTDAAGAVADGTTVARAIDKDLDPWDYLHRNDAYRFFEHLNDLLITGPTRTNVMDVYMILCGK